MVIKCCQATESQDVFAADVLYHHSCYNRFAYSYEEKSTTKTERTNKEISVISAEEESKVLIKRKILIQKKCYLLTDLVEEMAILCEILLRQRKGR